VVAALAAKAGRRRVSGDHYGRAEKLPSQTKRRRTHRTRDDPFVGDWPWVEAQIRDDAALQANRSNLVRQSLKRARVVHAYLRALPPIARSHAVGLVESTC
jgi:hypothetical protein